MKRLLTNAAASAFVLLFAAPSFALQPGPCTDAGWNEVVNDVLWTIETDWGAKDCFQEQYSNGADATRGIIRCNPGLKRMDEQHMFDDLNNKQQRFVECAAKVCNFLKSKGYERGC